MWHKRTSIFWHDDTIKKIIYEEKRISDNVITYESIMEYDTELRSENREWLLPLTARGKKKKISATNILAVNPFGCEFHFYLDTANKTSVGMAICNRRNNKEIAIGELMTYQSEINNGGHSQYFFNTENTDDLQMNLVNVLSILPKELKDNLENAYKAYMVLEQNEDNEEAEGILEKCDDVFYENEQKIIQILEQYSAKNM